MFLIACSVSPVEYLTGISTLHIQNCTNNKIMYVDCPPSICKLLELRSKFIYIAGLMDNTKILSIQFLNKSNKLEKITT
jgi:hypothetical protein